MTNKITDGDYVKLPDSTNLQTVDYIDEVLQNIKIVLTAPRGSFYPNKNFGSLISTVVSKPINEYALCYARQALSDFDGVCVKSARVDENKIVFTVTVNETQREVSVDFENNI